MTRKNTLRGFVSAEPRIQCLTDSLLRYAGALQLLPDNATKWLRFARLVEVARTARPVAPQSAAMPAEIEAFLTSPPIAGERVLVHEDPFEGPFTAPVVFEGAEYLTVPGAVSSAATVCQFLIQALDGLPVAAAEAQELMRRDAARLLWVADTVARRGGLERWQEPEFDTSKGVHIPAMRDLRRFEAAVCIGSSDLGNRFGGLGGFSDLCWPEKRMPWKRDRSRLVDDRALMYPLSMNSSSDGLIVPSPNQIALSVVHRVAARAAGSGVHTQLMATFELAVLAEVERLCERMGWTLLDHSSMFGASGEGGVRDAVFAFDIDKLAHVVVFADDLNGYEAAKPHAPTDSTAQMRHISERMRYVRDVVSAEDPDSEVLHLLLMVPVGRPMHADFTRFEREGWQVLILTIDELRTIADHERNDSLGLWRFVSALNEIPLPLYGTVNNTADAYALYIQCDRRPRQLSIRDVPGVLLPPGFGENPRRLDIRDVPGILLPAGFGGPMAVEHRRRSDAHYVCPPGGSAVVPVRREAVSSTVGVYVPQHEDLKHLRLVELALPCWIAAHGANPQSQLFCAGVRDAVALHLWRIRNLVNPYLTAIADNAACVTVDIMDPDGSVFPPADADDAAVASWFESIGSTGASWFEIEVDGGEQCITVKLLPGAAVRLSEVAEREEEALVVEVVRSLASLVGWPSTVVDADLAGIGIWETPLPRFVNVIVGYIPGVHGGAALPGCRLKHQAEIDAVTDEIDEIASGLGLEFGPVPAERRVGVIQTIVRTLDSRLREELRELNPDATFEFLVSEQERMQSDRTKLRVMAPNPLIGSGRKDGTLDAVEKFHEINENALASRYLIESAVRCVRDGHSVLSLSRYDKLLAISMQMIAWGSIGDAYRLGLSNAVLHFREPGHLQMGPSDPLHQAVSYRTDINAHTVADSDLLAEWADFTASRDPSPAVDPVEESVFKAEFGVPLAGFVEAMELLSRLAACSLLQVVTIPVPELLRIITAETELTRPQAAEMLNMISLRADPADLVPDVFDLKFTPWRYARDSSYLRRPVLIRERSSNESVATWGTQTPGIAIETIGEQMASGRLAARSTEMKKYISRQRNRISREFETEIADIYRCDPRNQVSEQVKSLGNTSLERINGEKLGDIDVLVINEHHKTMTIIEAKHFAASRNPREIKGEIGKLASDGNSTVVHHHERVKFVQDHWTTLHRQLQLTEQADEWQIHSLIVTSEPSIAADLLQRSGNETGAIIIPINELQHTATSLNNQPI